MAKKSTTKKAPKRSTKASRPRSSSNGASADGKHLVIVESPAKARTINKYLGGDYVVKASVGHVRDLPKRNPKGVKAPVPGVDIDHGFQPQYEVIQGKGKTVTELKRLARNAADVYLATDLDREGEAIAWHLQEALRVPGDKAKRVVFNAITKDAIQRAFEQPRSVDMDRVNAQQARRILDRIVGYQVSPLLWKKVAGGLSAGRVQSVAVRLIVEREREIEAFIPDEYWKITGYFTADVTAAAGLREAWAKFLADAPEDKARTNRERNGWLNEHQSISTELIEINGERFEPKDVEQARKAAQLAGFTVEEEKVTEDPKGKGPAARRVNLIGRLGEQHPEYRVESIQTKQTKSRPYPPFITSTLQQTAANVLGMTAQSTMRTAQSLYEGVEIGGMGSIGLITYMRTDSTNLSSEAIGMARSFIEQSYGDRYLPGKPNVYRSSNKSAQEAHEAIRPTDVKLSPDHPAVKGSLDDRQLKLYRLIWQRFVACQMTPAEWNSTVVRIAGKADDGSELVFKGSGRTLVFDGFYKVVGVPRVTDELILPPLEEQQPLAPLQIDPQQKFTNPPPRYSEAALVKKLEAEGIGRPSTYASIIQVIQDRKYVDKNQSRQLVPTDLGRVVTDKLTEAFPRIMDVGYTRKMESELDAIETQHHDWVKFLSEFYGPFQESLTRAHEEMRHAKAEMEPAPYECAECGAATVYRFGKSGRFLSCSRYPDCKYAAPVDAQGRPQSPEQTDIACPDCGKPMVLRKGRFGPFLSCSGYPECKGIVKLDRKGFAVPPKAPPLTTEIACPKCERPLNLRSSKRGPWLSCSGFPKCRGRMGWSKLSEEDQKKWEIALMEHERAHPVPTLKKVDGTPVPEDYKPQVLSDESGGEESEDYDTDAA